MGRGLGQYMETHQSSKEEEAESLVWSMADKALSGPVITGDREGCSLLSLSLCLCLCMYVFEWANRELVKCTR